MMDHFPFLWPLIRQEYTTHVRREHDHIGIDRADRDVGNHAATGETDVPDIARVVFSLPQRDGTQRHGENRQKEETC